MLVNGKVWTFPDVEPPGPCTTTTVVTFGASLKRSRAASS